MKAQKLFIAFSILLLPANSHAQRVWHLLDEQGKFLNWQNEDNYTAQDIQLALVSNPNTYIEISPAEDVVSFPYKIGDKKFKASGKSKEYRKALAQARYAFVTEKLIAIGIPETRIREGPILAEAGFGAYIKLIKIESIEPIPKPILLEKIQIIEVETNSYDFLGQTSINYYAGIFFRKNIMLNQRWEYSLGIGIGRTDDFVLRLGSGFECAFTKYFKLRISIFGQEYNLIDNVEAGFSFGFLALIKSLSDFDLLLEIELENLAITDYQFVLQPFSDVKINIGFRF